MENCLQLVLNELKNTALSPKDYYEVYIHCPMIILYYVALFEEHFFSFYFLNSDMEYGWQLLITWLQWKHISWIKSVMEVMHPFYMRNLSICHL